MINIFKGRICLNYPIEKYLFFTEQSEDKKDMKSLFWSVCLHLICFLIVLHLITFFIIRKCLNYYNSTKYLDFLRKEKENKFQIANITNLQKNQDSLLTCSFRKTQSTRPAINWPLLSPLTLSFSPPSFLVIEKETVDRDRKGTSTASEKERIRDLPRSGSGSETTNEQP